MFTKVDELIWTDEKYKKMSDDGKFLFLYVLSCPHRNILGFYFLPIPYGSFDLNWKPERFAKGLQELLDNGLISYNFSTNIIFIKNFLKYNPLENPNQVKGAIKALNILPTNGIDADLVKYLESINKPFMKPLLELLGERLGKQVDVDVDVKVDIDINIDIDKKKSTKTKYGEYNNVLLTDDDLEKLKIEFPNDYKQRIERVSEYCASTGKSYKNYLATVRNWAKKEVLNGNFRTNDNKGTEDPWGIEKFITRG